MSTRNGINDLDELNYMESFEEDTIFCIFEYIKQFVYEWLYCKKATKSN